VQDFGKNGKPGKTRTVCTAKGSACPCGTNAKSCDDEQDASAKVCVAKFGKTKGCPTPCAPSDEKAGKATCVQAHLDSKGGTVGEAVSCVVKGKCAPGRGQKTCPSGATISSGYTCKNIYGVSTKKGRRLKQRRLETSAGSRQTAGISFTLQDLKGGDVANVKVKLDSTMMLQSELKSTLSMVKSGSVASMMYKVTNLGTSKVAPSVVTDKLRGYLNSGHSGTKTVLSVLGTVKLGPKGCCSLTQKVKAVVDKKVVATVVKPTTTKAPTTKAPPTKAPTTSRPGRWYQSAR